LTVVLGVGCARAVPTATPKADLPPLRATPGLERLDVRLGPQGREAMVGEYRISPESMGLDIGSLLKNTPALSGNAVWCVEPQGFLGEVLVLSVGMSWWPPGTEPGNPSRSITEALMRCLGFLEGQPWGRAVVYLKPGSLPGVQTMARPMALQEGTDTLMGLLEGAFLFGVTAPFQARGMAYLAPTQDAMLEDQDRGVKRQGEAHVKRDGRSWSASNRLVYSATEDAAGIKVMGKTAATVVEGVSYVMGSGEVGKLMPTVMPRAVLRVKGGIGRSVVTMTAMASARYSPGLSCVLRTLSPPQAAAPPPPNPDGGPPADGDGGPVVYPGVDLEAAQRCVLTEEDHTGPPRKFN
jgi:hypothetical protein